MLLVNSFDCCIEVESHSPYRYRKNKLLFNVIKILITKITSNMYDCTVNTRTRLIMQTTVRTKNSLPLQETTESNIRNHK